MPNIVMIDFADDLQCQQIRGLNDLSDHDLAALGSSISQESPTVV